MGLFRKNITPAPAPIPEFWRWWTREGKSMFTNGIDAGSFGSLPKKMSKFVDAMHPDLAWDTSKGTTSEHELCISGGDIPGLRSVAERWLRSAPAADEVWQYSAAKRRSPESMRSRLDIGRATVDLTKTRFVVDATYGPHRLDVTVYNPAFATVAEETALQVAFLALDWTLGEDDVARWIGPVGVTDSAPVASTSPAELIEIADGFAAERDANEWTSLRITTTEGSPGLATVRTAVRWIDYPTFDLLSVISIGYGDATPEGLPAPDARAGLKKFEDALVGVLGGGGVLVGTVTSDNQRVFLVYSDSEDQNVTSAINGFMAAQGTAKALQQLDPGWHEVRFITG